MYISCSTLVCETERYPRVADGVRQIKDLGFESIDLAAFEDWQNVDPSYLVEEGEAWAEDFASVLSEFDMQMSSINAGPSASLSDPDPASFDAYQEEFLALVKLAERLDCPNLTVQPGKPRQDEPFEVTFARSGRRLQKLGEMLGDDGAVTLSLEGHEGSLLEKPVHAFGMMEALWPTVGFTYDPSHFVMQGFKLAETELLLPYVRHVHVRNASLDNMQASMEEGIIDFEWVVFALREHDYTGAVSVEYFSGFDGEFESTLALRDRLLELGVERSPS